MAHRLFQDNGEWCNEALYACNEISILLEDVLSILEDRCGGPVDLKDFHYVAQHGLGGFVADLSIRRRLGNGDESPKKLMEDFPRLKNNLQSHLHNATLTKETE